MTLILGIRSKSEIIVRADGFSTHTSNTEKTITKRNLKKVFASVDHPVGLAHHGENQLDNSDVGPFLQSWLNHKLPKQYNHGINIAACVLGSELDSEVRKALEYSKHRKSFGVWIFGWWPCTAIPEIIEIYWKKYRPDRIRLHMQSFGDFSWAGSGAKYANHLFNNPNSHLPFEGSYCANHKSNVKLMQSWYNQSLALQSANNEENFGGECTQVFINREKAVINQI